MSERKGIGTIICEVSLLMFDLAVRNSPALKAPAHASPGQRPGFRDQSNVARPERAQEPLRPVRANDNAKARYPGRCPGLASSAP